MWSTISHGSSWSRRRAPSTSGGCTMTAGWPCCCLTSSAPGPTGLRVNCASSARRVIKKNWTRRRKGTIRGVVHSQIGCTDFKFSKKILGFIGFFLNFFLVFSNIFGFFGILDFFGFFLDFSVFCFYRFFRIVRIFFVSLWGFFWVNNPLVRS